MKRNKKVLIICRDYPPCASPYGIMGAMRIARFVKYLPCFGWYPVVVCKNTTNSLKIKKKESSTVIRVPYKIHFFPSKLLENTSVRFDSNVSIIKKTWHYLNEYFGWKSYAYKAARDVILNEKIDLIFSSCLPITSHLIASRLQRKTHLPWVAEYRDLFLSNPYRRHILGKKIEKIIEKKVVEDAELLVAVSEPLAKKLRQLHKKRVVVITNSFDPEDYLKNVKPTPYFSITYTGRIYEGKEDPSPLFLAVRKLLFSKKIDVKKFKVRFYGPVENISFISNLAKKYNVERVVKHYGLVPHNEAIVHQQESSVLVLLNRASTEEKGILTGKIFEYLGARRPILAIPSIEGSVVNKLLIETKSGIALSNYNEIADILMSLYDEFLKKGKVGYKGDDKAISKYSAYSQTQKLVLFFNAVLSKKHNKKI